MKSTCTQALVVRTVWVDKRSTASRQAATRGVARRQSHPFFHFFSYSYNNNYLHPYPRIRVRDNLAMHLIALADAFSTRAHACAPLRRHPSFDTGTPVCELPTDKSPGSISNGFRGVVESLPFLTRCHMCSPSHRHRSIDCRCTCLSGRRRWQRRGRWSIAWRRRRR